MAKPDWRKHFEHYALKRRRQGLTRSFREWWKPYWRDYLEWGREQWGPALPAPRVVPVLYMGGPKGGQVERVDDPPPGKLELGPQAGGFYQLGYQQQGWEYSYVWVYS